MSKYNDFLPNSFQVPNALVDNGYLAVLKGAPLSIYLLLARKIRGYHKASDAVSISQLIEYTGYARDAVIAGARELEKLGLVERVAGSITAITRYTLTDGSTVNPAPKIEKKRKGKLVGKSDKQADDNNSDNGKNVGGNGKNDTQEMQDIENKENEDPSDTEKTIGVSENPENDGISVGEDEASRKIRQDLVGNSDKNLSENPTHIKQRKQIKNKECSSAVAGEKKKKAGDEYTEDFLRFWDAYPKCERKSAKAETFKTFKKYAKHLDTMLKVLEVKKLSDTWIKNNGAFIPAPTAWLNKQEWENEFFLEQVARIEAQAQQQAQFMNNNPYQQNGQFNHQGNGYGAHNAQPEQYLPQGMRVQRNKGF